MKRAETGLGGDERRRAFERRARGVGAASLAAAVLVGLACSSSSTPGTDGGDDDVSPGHEGGGPGDGGRDATRPGDGSSPDGARDAQRDATLGEAGDAADAAGPPSLVALSVTSTDDASPGLALIPAFSPAIFDYYVRCSAGTNALTVALTASPGAEAAITQPSSSPKAHEQTVNLDALENQAIVAVASAGSESTQYWVRCLPHDFPMLQMIEHPEAGAATPGYYLIGNFKVIPGEWGYAIMLDSHGVPVWYYREPLSPGKAGAYGVVDVDSLSPGDVSFTPVAVAYSGPYYELASPSPPKLGYVEAPELDEHELQRLPNGNYLVFSIPVVSADMTGLTITLADGGTETFGKDTPIFNCDILEIDPKTQGIVNSWSATDHFDPEKDLTFRDPSIVIAGGVVEPFHCNSIAVDSNGDLLVSSRQMDSVFYIEWPGGKVLWKMGGSPYNKDGAPFIPNTPSPFLRQHDARLQPSWSYACGGGQISVFDDHTSADSGVARGVVYDVTVPRPGDAGDADCGPGGGGDAASGAKVAWQYPGRVQVTGTGSFRILADGSRTIDWGFGGGMRTTFTEVDEAGDDLFDFNMSYGDFSYRAIKVPATAFKIETLRATAGSTISDAGAPDASFD